MIKFANSLCTCTASSQHVLAVNLGRILGPMLRNFRARANEIVYIQQIRYCLYTVECGLVLVKADFVGHHACMWLSNGCTHPPPLWRYIGVIIMNSV